MLNIALPKGRLGLKVYGILERAGYTAGTPSDDDRKLIMTNPEAGISYFWVKPSDVATYVECGAADVGIVGKDILMEQQRDVYELLDLGIGVCRLAVAAKADFVDNPRKPLRVATSYVNAAQRYYDSIGREVVIIPLHGSVELGPLTDLSDVIVDIVETGRTLADNGLVVVNDIFPVSARFIANRASYEFKKGRIQSMVADLEQQIEGAR